MTNSKPDEKCDDCGDGDFPDFDDKEGESMDSFWDEHEESDG